MARKSQSHVQAQSGGHVGQRQGSGLLEADFGRDLECCVLPADGVLGEAAGGGEHLVEGGDAVAGREFVDVRADAVDDAGDVVA